MSPSLPPPPRKLSSGNSAHSSSSRYPKVNPNSLAASDPLFDRNDDDDEALDLALAELLGQSHISPLQRHQHLPQCKHYGPAALSSAGARPLSIASVSSLGSGSYSSFGSTHSRRVSQAYLSPLSPTLSEPSNPSGSYFSTLTEDDDECPQDPTLSSSAAIGTSEYDMSLAASSLPSCTYCSSVRSNSVCSSGTQDDKSTSVSSSLLGGAGLGLSSPSRYHHQAHRDSVHQLFDNNRLAVLKEYVPSEVRLRLSYHLDECWFLHFSPSGQYMASTGLDHSIILWQDLATPEPTAYKTIQFPRTITHVEWSPDSKYVLVNLGFDAFRPQQATEFHLIDVAAGEVILKRKHRDGPRDIPVNAIGWMTDSKRFITAPRDGLVYIWNLEGEVVQELDMDKTVDIMYMVPGENKAVITSDNKVEVISFEGEESKYVAMVEERPTVMSVSPDGSYLSISIKSDVDLCRPAQILIYDFRTLTFLRALEADSYVNERFIIMPAFLGPNKEILCAGSENGKLHFWDVETGEAIAMLEEHSKHCGWSAMHPTMPGLMASCSDDNQIIIWTTKDLSRALQDEDEKWMESRREELPHIDIKKGW